MEELIRLLTQMASTLVGIHIELVTIRKQSAPVAEMTPELKTPKKKKPKRAS